MEKWWDETESSAFYTVKFEANGGIPAPGDQKIVRGGKVGKVPPVQRNSDGFGGWYKDQRCTVEWNFARDTVNADMTLYAKWTSPPQPIYKVTFDPNGGRPEPDIQLIAAGVKVIEPTALRKSDLSNGWLGFGGWYSDSGLINQWNFAADTVTKDITLYAKWLEGEPAHCSVTFDADGGTPEPRTQDLIRGSKIIEPYAVSKEGYGFAGWYTDPYFTNQWNFSTDTVSNTPGSSMTLYAKWVTNYCIVKFNANGGSPAPKDLSITYGSKVTVPPVMRKSGYGFGGWYTDPFFTNEWNFNTPVFSDMTLYADWSDEYFTIVFDSIPDSPAPGSQHGNILPDNQLITAGAKISEPSDISRFGLCFAGWYTKKNGGDPWDFDNIVTDEVLNNLGVDVSGTTVTLYAYWVPEDPNMIWVKRGSFIMGDNTVTGAKPAHKVTIDNGFYIGRYPVTQAEFNSVMFTPPAHANHFNASGDTAPVDSVFWDEAIDYCNKLSNTPGLITSNVVTSGQLQVVYSGSGTSTTADFTLNGYRLPTEAEWEYAARGGNGSPGNYIYAGSNTPDDVGWYNTNSGSMTRPVGTKQPNGLGIYDMSGNISEWCWDWFDANYYSGSPTVNPRGPATGTERSRRGGSWSNAYGNIRTTIRNSFRPTGDRKDFWNLGFRIVRGPVTGPSYTGL